MRRIHWYSMIVVMLIAASAGAFAQAESDVTPRVDERFASPQTDEVPDFQKHIVPLFGRLGCNGRACHGSFQGQGGFRLSLFGYDFQTDHEALLDEESPRVVAGKPNESLIIQKPTDADMHEGGQRYELGSWQHHVIQRWIAGGAAFDEANVQKLMRLEVTPSELQFSDAGEGDQLRAVAVWEDGTREDVTPLCRFQSNDEQVVKIDAAGRVTAGQGGDTHLVVSYDNAVVAVPVIRPVSELVGDQYPEVPTPTRVDELVVAKLRKLGVVPSALSDDAEFLRRVRLDMTGTLPTPQEIEAFLEDTAPDKRARKIDELLESPAFAAWWTTKLCDWTGNNDDQLVNATPTRTASREWYDWIYQRVRDNVAYDELVEGMVTATSRGDDQSYLEYCEQMSGLYRDGAEQSYADLPSLTHYWARRDFREPEARAIGFAYAFMGIRIQCAQCHKHPFDQWSKEDFHLFKNFFSGVVASNRASGPKAREQYNQLIADLGLKDKRGGQLRRELGQLLRTGKTVPFPEVYVGRPRASREYRDMPVNTGRLLGGESFDLRAEDDPRQRVMEWLRSEDNRFFARAFVNRVWASYFSVGIVDPPDDNSLANPPSNERLLDYLARGFIESGFDMQWVHRTIANSRTYQLSWQPNETNRMDERNFSRAVPRRLPAEVVYDAIEQATASDARLVSLQTDLEGRAIAIPGASNRGRGLDRNQGYALTVFGRSTRESNCDCDRSEEASLLQTVFLQNDQAVLSKLDARGANWLEDVDRLVHLQRNRTESAKAARRLQGLRKQMVQQQQRLKKLREGDNQAAVQRTQARLAALKKQALALRAEAEEPPEDAADVDIDHLVTQAYLRTLSRYPTDRELERSRQHLQEAQDVVSGTRDLMWALLNTKEFIVNH